jgi:hypothetical protein
MPAGYRNAAIFTTLAFGERFKFAAAPPKEKGNYSGESDPDDWSERLLFGRVRLCRTLTKSITGYASKSSHGSSLALPILILSRDAKPPAVADLNSYHFSVTHRKSGNAFGGTPKAAGEDARAPQSNCLDTTKAG